MIGDGGSIILPSQSNQVEYEGEIGVVIGARLSHSAAPEASRSIRGICALNDVTARDLQKTDKQWTRAKGFDTFCAIGPETAPPSDLGTLVVLTRVNGVERQRGAASDMVFSIPTLLSYISGIMTLEPGDVVATGTPAGVGRLVAGDVVEVEIPGFSAVRNPVTNIV